MKNFMDDKTNMSQFFATIKRLLCFHDFLPNINISSKPIHLPMKVLNCNPGTQRSNISCKNLICIGTLVIWWINCDLRAINWGDKMPFILLKPASMNCLFNSKIDHSLRCNPCAVLLNPRDISWGPVLLLGVSIERIPPYF